MNTAAPAAVRPIVRRSVDGALLVGGAALLVLATLPVDPHSVTDPEAAVFAVLNHPAVLPIWLVWPVMQLGNLVVIPVSAALAAWRRRWRLAAGLLLAGLGTYLGAKVVKGLVPRGRPDDLLHDVVIRGGAAVGRGFPSGHAAVVAAIVAIAWPWLGRRARIVCVVLAVAVCWARVYVGAHLPLDVVGGAALGLALAGLVKLLLGRPS